MSRNVLIHKVGHENIDSILSSYFDIPSQNHLYALRTMVSHINRGNTGYKSSHCGKTLLSQPSPNDFLILPTEDDLRRYNFYSAKPDFSQFDSHGHSFNIKTRSVQDKRLSMLKVQSQVEPAHLVATCNMMDGLCASLAKEKEHKFSDYLKEYTKESFTKAAEKFGERGAEIIKLIKKIDKLGAVLKIKGPGTMQARQAAKAEMIKLNEELQKLFSTTFKKYVLDHAHSSIASKVISPTNAKAIASSSGMINAAKKGATSIFVKKEINSMFKYLKYSKFIGDITTGYEFVEAQINALSARKEGKEWQKELFVEDSGVLGMIVASSAITIMLPLEVPLLIGAAITAAGAIALGGALKALAEKSYNTWLL